jgi:hypothetical protein
MNYQKIYNDLIEKRKEFPYIDGYSEKHHILPRSLGGSDDKDNLVQLSAKEHYIAHLLLCKIYENDKSKFYKMVKAFVMMSTTRAENCNGYFNSNTYQLYREEFSKAMSETQTGIGNSQYNTQWIYNNDLKESKKIPKSEKIPEGWLKGRVLNFSYLDKCCNICGNNLQLIKKSKSEICNICKNKNLKNIKEKYVLMYNKFINDDYESINKFAQDNNISHVSLIKNWKILIPEYDKLKTVEKRNKILSKNG